MTQVIRPLGCFGALGTDEVDDRTNHIRIDSISFLVCMVVITVASYAFVGLIK